MLNVVKSTDPITRNTIIVAVYGYPGAGKTTLGFSAEAPLLLDFDLGAHRTQFRGDAVQIEHWSDVVGLSAEDLKPYKTVVVDTAGRCLDVMSMDIMAENPKMRTATGQLTLGGWGCLKGRFAAWLRDLRSYGLDIVLLAHGAEKSDGDDLILRPDVPGGSYGEIFKVADGVGYLRIVNSERVLAWDPQDRFVGKNPGMIPPAAIPNMEEIPDYLAGLVEIIKARMGNLSTEAATIRDAVVEWRDKVKDAKSAKVLTGLVKAVNEELEGPALLQVKTLIADRAKSLEVSWDKSKKAFAKKAATKPVTAPATTEDIPEGEETPGS